MKLIELRGEEGSYLIGRILKSGRLLVLDSNVLGEGTRIDPDPDLPWKEAARLRGDVTVLSPEDLLEAVIENADDDDWGDEFLDDYLRSA